MRHLKLTYRSVFLSDLHLGSGTSMAEQAADFLKAVECDTLYLVGDIVDMWRLKSRWRWPDCHHRFARRVLKMAQKGTRVVYIPGNHDDAARQYEGLNFGGIVLQREAIHTTADRQRLLVMHGDEVDLIVKHARLLSVIGGAAYDRLVHVSRWYNRYRRLRGKPYWSLSHAIKLKVKSACKHIARFESAIEKIARERGVDGVVCGHIHKAEIRRGASGLPDYFNCGDWVESGTALVEHDDGTMQIVDGIALVERQRELQGGSLSFADDADQLLLPGFAKSADVAPIDGPTVRERGSMFTR
ncbi:MAG: UDP-2,3-diacylglucosamine diphosphatase [Phycisphaerales bacterium]